MIDVRARAIDADTIEDVDPEDIAERADVDSVTVQRVVGALAEFEAERRPWRDPDELHRLYYRVGLDQREIADRLECGQRTVSRWMKTFEISPGRGRGHLSAAMNTTCQAGWESGP